MSAEPVSEADAAEVRSTIMWFLGIAAAAALFVIFTYSWLDSRKTPTIVFLATPEMSIAVDVRGAVSTPGVVYLDPGDRMIDLVESAGGLAPNADQSLINLSTRLSDGQVVMIPTQVPQRDVASAQTSSLININTASVEELKQLPGIGDVLAQRIVAYREFNGPFLTVDGLAEVDGISQNVVDAIRQYVTVTGDG